jgi:hypothetical protein
MSFPIRNPRDLLAKAKREIDRLEEEADAVNGEPNPIVVADLTINAAWTLWHTTDWIAFRVLDAVREIVPQHMHKPARKRTERFQIRLRNRSRDLRICWGLALRYKHLELETEDARTMFDGGAALSAPSSHREYGPEMSSGPTPVFIPLFSSEPESVQVDEVAFSIQGFVNPVAGALHSTTLHPKVTYRKRRLRLVDVYRDAYDFLDQLLKKHRA